MPHATVLFTSCNSSSSAHLLVLPDGRRIGGMLRLPGRVCAIWLELDLQGQLGAIRLCKILRSLPSILILPKTVLVARSAFLLCFWMASVVVRSTLVAVSSIMVHIRIVSHFLLSTVHIGVLQEGVADGVLLAHIFVAVVSAAPLIILIKQALLLQLVLWINSIHSKRLKYLPLRLGVIRTWTIEVVYSVAVLGVSGARLACSILLIPPSDDDGIPRSRIAAGSILALPWLEDIAVGVRINNPTIR